MTKLDLARLIKVLGMTGSVHDGEALAALRTATKMMANAKVTWADILKPAVKVEPKMDHRSDVYGYQPYRRPPTQQDPEEILRQYREWSRDRSDKAASDKYKDHLYESLFGKKRRP
jgi:flavorubredoxin